MKDHIAQLVRRLRRDGVEFDVRGDRVLVRPIDIVSESARSALTRNKGSLLAHLYREKANEGVLRQHGISDDRLGIIEELIRKTGRALVWSDVLNDLVFFCRDEKSADESPRGVVAYTLLEAELLFGDPEWSPSPDGLRMIHNAKRLGGGAVRDVTHDKGQDM